MNQYIVKAKVAREKITDIKSKEMQSITPEGKPATPATTTAGMSVDVITNKANKMLQLICSKLAEIQEIKSKNAEKPKNLAFATAIEKSLKTYVSDLEVLIANTQSYKSKSPNIAPENISELVAGTAMLAKVTTFQQLREISGKYSAALNERLSVMEGWNNA